ncbi:hypothetical protein CIB48_g1592 [Xylaria polymorpha]|nr:hypothetical protein CIB48_g1592 [Xylaria polymorpha]
MDEALWRRKAIVAGSSAYRFLQAETDRGHVQLQTLFDPRKMLDGETKTPRRVLIRGRAGVGRRRYARRFFTTSFVAISGKLPTNTFLVSYKYYYYYLLLYTTNLYTLTAPACDADGLTPRALPETRLRYRSPTEQESPRLTS